MDAKNNAVSDPKSGRDSSPQNPKAVKPYTSFTKDEAKNELKQTRAELSRVRSTMSEMQQQASNYRRKLDFVPEDLRVGLRQARQKHRDLTRSIRVLEGVIAGLSRIEEEE